MVQYGMTPLAVLQADLSERSAAARIGRIEIGKLKPGYFADIIAVPGNPLDDISVLAEGELRHEERRGVSETFRPTDAIEECTMWHDFRSLGIAGMCASDDVCFSTGQRANRPHS